MDAGGDGGGAEAKRLAVVDDDDAFRTSLSDSLRDHGYDVVDFCDGAVALEYLNGGGRADLVLLDWWMTGTTGLQVLEALRRDGLDLPVLVLTGFDDQVYEEAALKFGAVDFVEKSRRPSILHERICRALQPPGPNAGAAAGRRELRLGELRIDRESARAYWRDEEVPLTIKEFRVVDCLAARAGADVRFRQIYDQVHGEGFIAGSGDDGYRGNVRTMIKRIRQKFRALDPGFDAIETYPGHGYRWRAKPARRTTHDAARASGRSDDAAS